MTNDDDNSGGGLDPVVEHMLKNGVVVTRENYIFCNWGTTPPDPWTIDEEDQLPKELQRTDIFTMNAQNEYVLKDDYNFLTGEKK
jgi:hypothetical protein